MFSRLNISRKILLVLLPLFLLAVGTSVYLSHHYQEHQALEQMQSATHSLATVIKESLVQMMVTSEQVDDAYLRRIGQNGDVENVSVWFFADSLHLDADLLSPHRTQRLRNRELKPTPEQQPLALQIYSKAEAIWLVQCEIGKHTEGIVEVLSSGRPLWLQSCERLKVILPFAADRRCLECHNVGVGTVLGAAYMEMPLGETVRALASNAERTIWIFGIFTLAALGIGALLFRAFVSRPMNRLMHATHIVGGGNLDHPVAAEFAGDEFGDLAHSFDAMQRRLKESQEKLLHEERLSAVGMMASTIVHDLRSPLTAVLLALDMVKKNDEGIQQPFLNTIHASVLRMNRMAQELLDFARGELSLQRHEIRIAEFVQAITDEMTPILEQSHIRFTVSGEYHGMAFIDKDRLHRALANIINNAFDVLPRGGEIRLTVTRKDDELILLVSDTGPGIPPEIKDHIFEPFVTAGKAKGTGLGLSITKEIIQRHGGSISWESMSGQGTTFTVKIPLHDHRSTIVQHENVHSQITTHTHEKEK
ncbi:MAG: HAMP domain-containing sensor histidine kinase [Bacteroidota bacterium]